MDLLAAMTVFVRVVDHKSFSMAASDLGISSSSVSKQISHLEQHVGARLLQRTTRRLSVTEVGSAYYEKCQKIIDQVEEAESLVDQLQGKPRGQLRINCNMTFGQLLLAKAIPEFMDSYPDIEVDLTLDDGEADIIRDGFDVALRISRPSLPDSSLIAREIASFPLLVCASPVYLEQRGEPLTPQELNQHNCLQFMLGSNARAWTLSNDQGSTTVQVTGDLRANNSLVVRQAAIEHRGLACLASFAVQPFINSGQLKVLFQDYQPERLSLFAVYPDRKYVSPKVSLFIEFFRSWLEMNLEQAAS